jgi:uncharacterized protein YbaP (TraB family)
MQRDSRQRSAGTACALVGSLALWLTPTANAQSPQEAPGPGLPMWVVRDDDSTIYITGTIHLLRDDQQWRSAKLEAAFAEASELYLELAEIGDERVMEANFAPLLEKYAAYDGAPVSSLLNEQERVLLGKALAQAGAPADVMDGLDKMQPWMTIQRVSRDQFTGGVYKSDNGIDFMFARMAHERGIPIHGMEDLETQLALMGDSSVEDQIARLRAILNAPPSLRKQRQRLADVAFGSWLRGETHMTEALIVLNHMMLGEANDPVFKNRNEAWAGVVEDMLTGSGTTFIAVGAGHLVGPNSLQDRLKLRGIMSERY